MFDRLLAMLLSEAALLHAAERQLVIDDLRRVNPGIARFDPLCRDHGFVDIARPHRGAQAEDRVVSLLEQFLYESIGDLVDQIESLDGETGLAAVEEATYRSGAYRPIEIRVLANDHRIAATQFQSDMLEILGGGLHHVSSGVGGAGK